MAISVSVPKDMNKIKTKVALNLTKRQIICFGAGAVVALPLFFLFKKYVGMETSLIISMVSASPFFVFGIYEKNGIPAETLLYYSIRHNYLRPQIRPRSTDPYFDTDPSDDDNPADELPINASPTEPGNAQGFVTEHFMSNGREFYTIQTINGKVFYLIVDMTTEEEMVYFVTEINENDLLNTTSNNSETLPRNSAVAEGKGLETSDIVVNNNASESTLNTIFGAPKTEDTSEVSIDKKDVNKEKAKEVTDIVTQTASNSSGVIYIAMGVLCVLVIVFVYLGKKKKKKKAEESAANQANEADSTGEDEDEE